MNHEGPDFTAPNHQRCEALVKGHPNYVFEWMRHDHRCHKTANQSRGSLAVCHVHGRAKSVTKYTKENFDAQ